MIRAPKIDLCSCLSADYEALVKSQQEMLYQTHMSTFIQEPKVGEIAPGFAYSEYEKEYEKEQALIRKKMAKDTVMVRTFVEDQVSITITAN